MSARAVRRRRGANALRLALAAMLLVGAAIAARGTTSGAQAASGLAGSQGTDTSLADASGAVTVAGRGPFSSLRVHVNQTANLVNQAISISWTGASPTFSDPATGAFNTTFAGQYLQIFECWGDPDPTDPLYPTNPGPAPTQCQFGAESNNPTAAYPIPETGFEYSRVVSQQSWSDYASAPGWVDASTGYKILPFDSVDGTVVNQQADYNYLADPLHPSAFWLEPYFSFNTSNELPFARSYPSGSGGAGQQLFQVQTGLEAPGLGCGQKLQPVAGGGTKVPRCWLVVVPRDTPTSENPPGLTGVRSVVTSPLAPTAWANRIAIPLTFRPIDTACSLGAQERRVLGSELAVSAFESWNPALCAARPTSPYNYSYASDDLARQNLLQHAYGSAGLSVFTDPPDSSAIDPQAKPVFAPLTLSAIVVGVNIERVPALQPDGQPQAQEVPLAGVRVAHIRLTPRLVAKLLTESYLAQLVAVLATKPAADRWILQNPATLVSDPDFLQFNPEFTQLATRQAIDASGLIVEQPSSDAARAVWRWILADREARAWLDGAPDPWGMRVNPLYSTSRQHNTTGVAFGTPTPNSFPKSDPYCFDTGDTVGNPPQKARPICILDWSPYALTMQRAAQAAGSANSGAHDARPESGTSSTAWKPNGPQKAGTRFVLSITDSPSARRYGIQMAALSRAGDDAANRSFVDPSDPATISAAAASMRPDAPTGVLQLDPAHVAHGAYPLSLLTYAAASPRALSASDRTDYAALLRYATGAGQTSGSNVGQLPAGYIPLPSSLRATAAQAIHDVLHPPAPPVTTTTAPTTPTTTGIASGPVGGGGDGGGTSGPPSRSVTGPTGPPSTSTPPTTAVAQGTGTPLGAVTRLISAGAVRFAVPIVALLGGVALVGASFIGPRRRRLLRVAPVRARVRSQVARANDRSADRNVFEPW